LLSSLLQEKNLNRIENPFKFIEQIYYKQASIFLHLKMKVVFLFQSVFLVNVLHGSYIFSGTAHRPSPKCLAITKDVCTDTVVQECEDPVETVKTARECYLDSELQCHTVPESVCHDETVSVCETELQNFCSIKDKIEVEHVTSKACNTFTNQECTKVSEQKCENIPKETCTTEHVDECEVVNKEVCIKQAQQNCQDVTTESCDTIQETECKVVVDEFCTKEPKQECQDVTYKDCKTVSKICSHATTCDDPSTSCVTRVEQECKTVSVDNCRPVSRQECQTVPKTLCRPVTQPKCEVVYVDHCSYVPDHQCSKVPKTTCVPDTEQKCETVLVDSCRDVPRQDCKDVSEVVEKKVPSLVCNSEPREVCRDETKQVCQDQPRQVCSEEPKEVCDEFQQKTTHQTCKDVVKTNCLPVKELDCNYLERLSSNYNAALLKAGSDLVSQTKAHAQALVDVLEAFKNDAKAVGWVAQNVQGSACIGSLDDAIAATKASLEMITTSESDLTVFLDTFTKLKDQKDTVVLMRGTADMMLLMDSLLPKLTTISVNTRCRVKPQDGLQGMKDLTNLLTKMTVSNSLAFSQPGVLAIVRRTSSIVESTTTFLIELLEVFKRVSFCNSDSESSAEAVLALGDMFDKVATYLVNIGSDYDVDEIKRKNIKFTTLLVDSVHKLGDLDFNFLDCSSALDQEQGYRTTAKSLQDLANIIEEVGEEELATQLGISFDLDFNNYDAGSDLVYQSRSQIQALISVLEDFKRDAKAVYWIQNNIEGSPCINSLDDAIAATRAGLDIITASEFDLSVFLNTFTNLKDQKDTVVLMRGTADMLLQMNSLMTQMTAVPVNARCRVTPQDSLQGMKDLEDLLVKIIVTNRLPFSQRAIVERAAGAVRSSTTFLVELREVFTRVSFCNSDSESSAQAVLALGDIFDKVATFLVNIGSNYDTKEIRRKNAKFTTALVDNVEKLRDLDFNFVDCSSTLDQEQGYRKAAESLLDLANIIEEVGEEQLATQLGISFDLEF